jgi:hypothetical protein
MVSDALILGLTALVQCLSAKRNALARRYLNDKFPALVARCH